MARDWNTQMGDIEDSPNAAQGAQPQASETEDGSGFFQRMLGRWGSDTDGDMQDNADNREAPTHGLANLRHVRVEDVAIPKAEIVAVSDTITESELVDTFRESGMTRLPVYESTLDHPIGMLHLKDFALNHGFNGRDQAFDLRKLLRPLLFVPPSMPIGVLLTKMQTERCHMALVIDEYGGVDGLVTIEDLIEQVIGEIEDEHDTDEDKFWVREKPGCYLVQAKTPLEDFEAEIGCSLTDHEDIDGEEIDTLGGLVFVLVGRVPARGEVVPHPAGLDLEVVDADPRRIKRLRVRLPGEAAPAALPAPGITALPAPGTAASGHD